MKARYKSNGHEGASSPRISGFCGRGSCRVDITRAVTADDQDRTTYRSPGMEEAIQESIDQAFGSSEAKPK